MKIRRKKSFNSTQDAYISTIQLETKGVRKEEKGIQHSNDIIIHLTFNHTEVKKREEIKYKDSEPIYLRTSTLLLLL